MKFDKITSVGKKKTFSHRFIFFLSIPIIILFLFTYIGNLYYTNHYRSALLTVCTNEFNRFLRSTEETSSDFAGDVSTLTSISEMREVCNAPSSDALSPSTVKTAQSSLLNIHSQMPEIESIIVVNRTGNFVMTSYGLYDLTNFFSQSYIYADYNVNFWRDYQSRSNIYKYLPVTTVTQSNITDSTSITPIVFSLSGNTPGTLVILNLDVDYIYSSFMSHQFTENSELYILDSETGNTITSTTVGTPLDLSAVEPVSDEGYYSVGNITVDSDEYYIISSQKRSNIFGFTYAVKIPYKDISSGVHQVLTSILLLGILVLIMMLIYLYLGSKKLAKPWISLAKRLSLSDDDNFSGNIINDIDLAITNLIEKNTGLAHNLAVSLPHSQQKYIADLLNNSSSMSDDEMNKLIFKHEYFISVAINISLKPTFPSAPVAMNDQLFKEVYKSLESVFAAKFTTFSLVGTNSTLYLILNVDSSDCSDELIEIKNQIHSLLSADTEYIDVFIGIGNTYKGIDGLRLSHQEALANIIKEMNENKIQIFDNSTLNSYSLSVYNENILINHLLTNHGEEAVEFVKNIFSSCSNKPAEIRTQIYTDLLKALYKAVTIKKIRIPEFHAKSEYEIIDDLLMRSEDEILTYFTDIIINVTSLHETAGKATGSAIVKYIQENYTSELYLDGLAERFNTTPKYLSKLLKQQMGISFKSYLTQLRISKAEELLLDKSVKINDISKEVGFLNHSSFIRAFKLKNGISPSEYRSLHTKK